EAAARTLRAPLCRVPLRPVTRLQGPLVQNDERDALGIQAGLDAVRRVAAGPRRRRRAEGVPLRPRLRRTLRHGLVQLGSRQVVLLSKSIVRIATRNQESGCVQDLAAHYTSTVTRIERSYV